MEHRRRQKWNNYGKEVPKRKSQIKPPRCIWQPAVPSWEREFCKVVGSLDWDTLLQMKKFVHLYDNVINWNDSAGKEAFCNAKKRFWAEKNGVPCDIALPDPDQYIDDINWDFESDAELLLDDLSKPSVPNTEENNDTVVIFGDSLISGQEFSPIGWGDYEEDVEAPTNSFSANNGDSWECKNLSNSYNDGTTAAWSGFCHNAWHLGNGSGHTGYMPWGVGWNNSWGWNNRVNYEVGHQLLRDNKTYEQQGSWGYSNFPSININAGGCVSNYRNSRSKGNDNYIN